LEPQELAEGNMKKFSSVIFAAAIAIITSVWPAFGNSCPTLIQEGRDLLAKANYSKTEAAKITSLLDESEKLHNSGDHAASVKKANEALSLLKRK